MLYVKICSIVIFHNFTYVYCIFDQINAALGHFKLLTGNVQYRHYLFSIIICLTS